MIKSRELADLISQLLTKPEYVEQLREDRVYAQLMNGLLSVVTDVCGGQVYGDVAYYSDDELFYTHVEWNDQVPDTGGIWDQVDRDIDWT